MKLSWNFHRGGEGGLRKNPYRGGGIDIFQNYTIKDEKYFSQNNNVNEIHVEKSAHFLDEMDLRMRTGDFEIDVLQFYGHYHIRKQVA